MKTAAYILVLVFGLAICGVLQAGPIDNARQFQEKAARSTMSDRSTTSLKKSKAVLIDTKGSSIVSPPASTKKSVEDETSKDASDETAGTTQSDTQQYR